MAKQPPEARVTVPSDVFSSETEYAMPLATMNWSAEVLNATTVMRWAVRPSTTVVPRRAVRGKTNPLAVSNSVSNSISAPAVAD
jgi:hypothetical protein